MANNIFFMQIVTVYFNAVIKVFASQGHCFCSPFRLQDRFNEVLLCMPAAFLLTRLRVPIGGTSRTSIFS
jgi:hypothetical protein